MSTKPNKRGLVNFVEHPMMGVSIHNWLKVLALNNFRIHVLKIPKVLFITGTAILNMPIQLYEYLRFSRKIKRQQVVAPVFIVGHPRSGTTYLHYLMSKDPKFGFCTVFQGILPHIFMSGGKFFRNLIKRAMPSTRPQDNVKITIDAPKEEEFAMANMSTTSYMFTFYFPNYALKHFKRSVVFTSGERSKLHWKRNFEYFIRKLALNNPNKRILLKSPPNTGRIKEILEIFPDAKFIHIHRDPLDVYQSTVRLYEKVGGVTSFQKADPEELKRYIIEAYQLMYMKYLEDIKNLTKDQLVEVSYASLEKNPMETLKGIYTALRLSDFNEAQAFIQQEIDDTEDYEKNSYLTISEEEKSIINEKWGEIAQKWGY